MSKCKWVDGKFEGCKKGIASMNWMVFAELDGVEYCPFCGGSLKKPVEIKIGMFGKFWDKDSHIFLYGILHNISDKGYEQEGTGGHWPCFTPGIPEEYNQDGTLKEES